MAKFRNDAANTPATSSTTAPPAPVSRSRFRTLDLGDAYALDVVAEEHLREVREQVRTGHYAPPVDDIAERIVAWLVPTAGHLV